MYKRQGEEICIKIDQTLTQDSTGTMAYLQLEAMDIRDVKTENSLAYICLLYTSQIIKFKKTDQDGKQLAGAEFELYYKENPDADYEKDKFVLYKENNGKGRIFLKESEKAPLGYTCLLYTSLHQYLTIG